MSFWDVAAAVAIGNLTSALIGAIIKYSFKSEREDKEVSDGR